MRRYSNIIGDKPLTHEVFQLNLFVGSMKKKAGALTLPRQAVRIFNAVKFPRHIFHNIFQGAATGITSTPEEYLKLKPVTALAAAALLCMNVAQAQDEPAIRLGPFEMQPRSLNPLREPFTGSRPTPVALDLDKDGDTDVVVANYPSSDGLYQEGFHYLKNEGTAAKPVFDRVRNWSNPFEFVAFGIGSTPSFSDLDKDGDADMLVGSMDGTLNYYKNKGEAAAPYDRFPEAGSWNASTKTGNPFDGVDLGDYTSPAFSDMDGDGDDDVVIGTSYLPGNKSVHYYINDGAGNFTPGTLQGINPVLEEVTPAFVDLDKDGDLDLLLGAADGKIYYYKRTGQTSFEEQTGAANPFSAIGTGAYGSPTAADFDNDGDADVIIGMEGAVSTDLLYFENMGNGTFDQKTGFANPLGGLDAGGDSSPYFVDLDNDNDRDLIIGNRSNTLRYYANVNGAYVEQASNPFASLVIPNTFAPAFIDLDGDGDKDLVGSVTGSQTRIEYYKNENGVFTHQVFSSGPFKDMYIDEGRSDFADIDNDGDFDLFVSDVVWISSESWYVIRYFKNTGTAQSPVFTEETGAANPLDQVSEDFMLFPRFTDIDHDGDLDVIIGEGGGIVETSDGNEFSYYENTGTPEAPVFAYRGNLVAQGDNPYEPAPAFVDQDNDGDLDIFMGGQSGYIAYYKNTNPAVVTSLNTTPHRVNFDSGPVVIDAQLLLADADNDSVAYATVSIGGFQAGKETLIFTPQTGITGTFNATTGVLTLRGKAPLQYYQALLRTVALQYTGELTSGRTKPYEYVTLSNAVTIQVFDSDATSPVPVSRTIIITDGSAPLFNDHTVKVVTRGSAVIDLAQLISDADNDVNLATLTIVQQPATGTTTLNGTSLTIEYKSDFTGTETLVLQVCDVSAACDQATITVNVTNVAPVIQSEPVRAPEGTTKTLNLLPITTDADGNLDASSITIVQPPVSGAGATIEVVSGTEVRLTLNYEGITFKGTDQLRIRACDHAGACTESILSVEVDVTTSVVVFNAVAPEKGLEKNRYMHIANLPETNKVSIFNRWGDAVFVMNNYDNNESGRRFEGYNDNGNSLASGTYFYKIEFTDQAQKRQTLTGYLTLKQ